MLRHFPELSPLVFSLKGTLLHNLSVLKALSGTCRGKADRKVPKDIIGKSGLGLRVFTQVCLGLLGSAWVGSIKKINLAG